MYFHTRILKLAIHLAAAIIILSPTMVLVLSAGPMAFFYSIIYFILSAVYVCLVIGMVALFLEIRNILQQINIRHAAYRIIYPPVHP